jgi:polar amino acid transport system substrate-binding protein
LLPATIAGADEPRLVAAGTLTWGSSPTFIPFEFMQDSKARGFDVDMMEELGKRLHLRVEMTVMEFKGVIPALMGKRVDAGVSGLYITPERLGTMDMIPYVIIGNQIVVRNGNPKHLDGPDSLCGAKVGVPASSTYEAETRKLSEGCTAAGKPSIDILSLPATNMVALALEQGRVDAALNSTATIASMISETPGAYQLASEPFDTNTRLGIAVGKDNVALRDALQAALDSMAKDGSYASLLAKWHLPAQSSVY